MNQLKVACATLFLCGLTGMAFGDEKRSASHEKLLGKWETNKAGVKITTSFLTNGKARITVTIDGQSATKEGTFTVDGDKITLTLQEDGKETKTTAIITTLTDTELVIEDERSRRDAYRKIKSVPRR